MRCERGEIYTKTELSRLPGNGGLSTQEISKEIIKYGELYKN